MDYRGSLIEGGGLLEILLLSVPVAGYLVYRRISKSEKFEFVDVIEGGFIAYVTISLVVLAAAFLLMLASVPAMVVVFLWSVASGGTFEQLKERWSREFGPVVKVDRMTRETIQNDKEKEPFGGVQSQGCA